MTHGVNFYLSIRRLMQVTGFRPDLRHGVRTAAVAVAAAALTLKLCTPLPLLLPAVTSGLVFLGFYFLLCRLFKVFHPRELIPFTRKKTKPAAASR